MSKTQNRFYLSMFSVAFALGAIPAGLTFAVDPYQVFLKKERPTAINDIAEKSHYPLWKLAKFKRGSHDTIILGDSRARALRDKYWHELKIPGALNLAYGGGTIPEVYSTFNEIKSDPAIRNLIIGVQLRSFDESHKGGMNRVPEAVRLVRHKLEYLKNWNVFQTTLKMFRKENESTLAALTPKISSANAAELGREGKTTLSKLLEPEVCFGCDFPSNLKPIKPIVRRTGYRLPGHYRYAHYGWGGITNKYDWDEVHTLYNVTHYSEDLPSKFDRQVRKNAKADWRGFEFSKKYWSYFEEISAWAQANNKKLIFVIPPTIVNMQQTIQAEGLGQLNHLLRLKLSELGTVIDLDFPNRLTRDISRFNDAYHFNSKVARQIVGQMVPLVTKNEKAIRTALKRERALKCTTKPKAKPQQITDQIRLETGLNCRIWSAQNEK